MKLLVFGGAGRVGSSLVRQALAEEHDVTATVRLRPLSTRHERLDIETADVMLPDKLEKLVTSQDCVVFAVGSPDRRTTLVYSDGVSNVVEAMRATGVRRLICFSSTIVELPEHGLATKLWTRFVIDKVRRNSLLDMARMEDEVRDSGLDWTVVRLPSLKRGTHPRTCRSAVNARLARPRPIGFDDAAGFVLHHLDDPALYRTTVEIGA